MSIPFGIAADPRPASPGPGTGHLYVADLGNQRIDEFTAWGEFVRAWGWGVSDGEAKLESCGPAEPLLDPPLALCRKSVAGAGKGQFGVGSVASVAVDGSGNVYVVDFANHRVQKFTSAGQFVLMFGGGVDKTTGEDVCTETSGDECQAGSVGTGPGEFREGRGLAISQSGTVLVGDEGRIEEFEAGGTFKKEFSVAGTVDSIAVDPTGSDFYAILRGKDDLRRFDPAGDELLPPLKVHEPQAVGVDPNSGDVYAVKRQTENKIVEGVLIPETPQEVVEFNSSGEKLPGCCVPALEPGSEGSRFTLTGLATNGAGDLYVSNRSNGPENYITALGPPPIKYGPPPPTPPSIDDQFLVEAGFSTATLKAKINPHFWDTSTYFVEYGTGKCSEGGCSEHQPLSPMSLTKAVKNTDIATEGVSLAGLSPGVTYHYRFVARTLYKPGSEEEPEVRGVGGEPGKDGAEGTFTTLPSPEALPLCPGNKAFRTGPSARLPDCRADEMVSPIDKENGDILTLVDITGFETRLDQSSVDGEALTYSSFRAFGGPLGGPYTVQYLARRGTGGWSSEALGGPLIGNFYNTALLEDEFKAFSPDLCEAWLVPGAEPTLAAGAMAGFPNLYRRQNCPKSYEALTTETPSSSVPAEYIPELQGHSADGSTAIFRVFDNLTGDAPPCLSVEGKCEGRVYEASGGSLSYVCVFPEGISAAVKEELASCSAGSPGRSDTATNRTATVSHAMSEDGSRVYWSASVGREQVGRIYVRVNGTSTRKVSETQTTKAARFWGATPDGSKALFEVEDLDAKNPSAKNKNLYLYEFGEAVPSSKKPIAGKVLGVAAASEDFSRIYFVSEEVLGGTTGAGKEKPNLYLDEEGTMTFIATLSRKDVDSLPSDATTSPVYLAPRTTSSGSRLAFISTEPLTGFDNRDAESGEADSEVFTYDAVSGKLACASCSPVGARAEGQNVVAPATGHSLWTAASLPKGETQLYSPRALSEDGSKLFFTSYTPLLPTDVNGKADVYEWEAAGSSESCKSEADGDFYAANGGCLFLISSGEDGRDSELVDVSPSGRDVFFTTEQSLLPQDPGAVDIYDAREGGGLPPPSAEVIACEPQTEGSCQKPPPPPPFLNPAEPSGEGNAKPISCRKGSHRGEKKGKEVCLKNTGKKHKHHKPKKRSSRAPR